jgi:hypothetical protein
VIYVDMKVGQDFLAEDELVERVYVGNADI